MPSGTAGERELLSLRNVKIRDRAFVHLGGMPTDSPSVGVRVDGACRCRPASAPISNGEREFGDEIAGMYADDAGADDTVSLFIETEAW